MKQVNTTDWLSLYLMLQKLQYLITICEATVKIVQFLLLAVCHAAKDLHVVYSFLKQTWSHSMF
jgi:hypothetical protein